MITIHIKKPKSSQLNRTQKGCGMRIIEGDYPIMIKKELYNKIKSKFNAGKAHTLYSHEFEGGSLKSVTKEIKKRVQPELKQIGRQLKKEAIQSGRELKKQAIQEGNMFIKDVAKPYLTELVQSGIVALGGAAAVAQPELAPWIGVGTLALSSMAGNAIEDFGKPKPKLNQNSYVSEQEYQNYQQQQPYQDPDNMDIQDPHKLFYSKIHDVSPIGMIGFGLRNQPKTGNGLFAGGRLLSKNGNIPQALLSPNPTFLMNRNLMSASMQNQTY